MSRCVAVCCSVLQCVVMCSSVLQCVAVCCSVCLDAQIFDVLQRYTSTPFVRAFFTTSGFCIVLQCVVVCCSVLQCVAVCCSVLQCVLQYVSDVRVFDVLQWYTSTPFVQCVMQCVAVCFSVCCRVLQCVLQHVS